MYVMNPLTQRSFSRLILYVTYDRGFYRHEKIIWLEHFVRERMTFHFLITGHPKVRVFMSHGGLLGSSETAYCGVPVVATPMYGDQVRYSLLQIPTVSI